MYVAEKKKERGNWMWIDGNVKRQGKMTLEGKEENNKIQAKKRIKKEYEKNEK
jgi:hypothetical protein